MEKKQQVQSTSCEILPKLFSKCLCDNLKWFQSPDVRIIVFCRLFTFFSFYFQKDDDVNWPVLKPDIFASIMDFFASNIPILTENQPASDTGRLLHEHQKSYFFCNNELGFKHFDPLEWPAPNFSLQYQHIYPFNSQKWLTCNFSL